MDEGTLLDIFINSSPLAGFAMYLVWQLQDVEKKFDQIILSIQQLGVTVQELRFKDIARDSKTK